MQQGTKIPTSAARKEPRGVIEQLE